MEQAMQKIWAQVKYHSQPRWPWQKRPIEGTPYSYPTVTGRLLALCLDLFFLVILSPFLRWVATWVYPAELLHQEEMRLASLGQAYAQHLISLQDLIAQVQTSPLIMSTMLQWTIGLCLFGGFTSWVLARWGFTPGMWFFRYRLRKLDGETLPSLGAISWRYVLGVLSFGVGYLTVPITKNHQAFHDLYSQTMMIKLPLNWQKKTPEETVEENV